MNLKRDSALKSRISLLLCIMKEEKEIRFIINPQNFKNIIRKIIEAGFQKTFVLKIEDVYYDNKNYSLLKSLEGYRKRKVEVISLNNIPSTKPASFNFVYKKKKDERVYEEEYKEEEFKKKVDGLNNKILIKKNRFVFKKEKDEIIIDVIRNLGSFLEIECESETDPMQIYKNLGFKSEWIDLIHKGVTELWLDKHLQKN